MPLRRDESRSLRLARAAIALIHGNKGGEFHLKSSEVKAQPPPTQSASLRVATNPYVGILAVFLGAGLATLNSRLLSVGLPDLRGALGISFDDASWLPTAFNMATMFSGVFVVFVNAFWGPRRILLPATTIFAAASFLLPFAA